jgi:hypothetical protein
MVPLGMRLTSYAIGRVNTFLQPLVVVRMLVLVVTTDPGVLVTSVVSFVCSLVNAKTFFGALSRDFRTTRTPADESASTISSPKSSLLSPLPVSELALVLEVMLDVADVEHLSRSARADRTSGGNEFQASKTDEDKVGLEFEVADLWIGKIKVRTSRV